MRNDMIQDAKKRKTELLLPAKDLEVLKTAVRYGADAVYIGGEAYAPPTFSPTTAISRGLSNILASWRR